MTRSRETIWFIGEARDRELRFCLRELEWLSRGRDVELFTRIDEIEPQRPADLTVVLQDWTHQYRAAEIRRLINAILPSGRLLCAYGSWCESDGRNADLWPHAVRVAARCAPERFERELNAISSGDAPLPLTAGRDERFEYDHSAPPSRLMNLRVCVLSNDRTLRESLQERLRAAGGRITAVRQADVILTDEADVERSDLSEHQRVIGITAMPQPGAGGSQQIETCVPLLLNDRQLIAAVSRAAGASGGSGSSLPRGS